ncbi:hypothetical protein [Aliarcobacter thereius]|uniref:Uncharacterized protein n=1 Tax=Aliarcobacter thereius TaxID=544718 RepID=A0A5R9GYD7_9BACT|nr:hypothetical protein [Aliarcobacter thereius]TLS71789.1 hypothetical protein FE246_05030 [Aliarcobacter thereius]TLT06093.1 hypothetical protein FE243_08985 [Aliarcobacter thereius]
MFLLTGCTAKYETVAKFNEETKLAVIKVDQDATSVGFVNAGNVQKLNYKYSFGVAATTAINNGFTYFSIYSPHELAYHYRDRKVNNVEEAYEACLSGDGSFRWQLTFNFTREGCDTIMFPSRETTISGTVSHRTISYIVELYNEDRKDNITFNAKEVLESDLLKGLNKDYFVPNKR